jgi:hypothetical protein
MKKLMRFIIGKNTMTGQKIKFFGVFSMFTLFCGCPPAEIPLGYDLVFDNKTSNELEIRFFNTGESTTFSENYFLNPLRKLETHHTVSFYKNEIVVEEFFKSWYEKTHILRNDTLLIEWQGPAYNGKDENHFYNINSWEIIDENSSSFVDGNFIFTINPEDIEQDETD